MAYTTINKSNLHMKVNLHSGTGSARNITGIGFQPDFTIVKRRDNTGVWYNTDIVRGAGKQMYLNETGGMGGSPSTTEITGFNSDGFNLGADAGVNASGGTFVSYNFLGNNTTGSSNTDGSITSTVSANTTAGFSIVKYTGTGSASTIGHGLGSAPKMIIVKCTSTNGKSWIVYTAATGNTHFMYLNASTAAGASSGAWNNTSPTASVFSLGNDGDVNASGDNYIAYCFADVQGYSKVGGSYTGNGNADGTFVYTGFKPSFVMVKASSTTANWTMFDNKRSPFNFIDNHFYANTNAAEQTASAGYIDFLSNGFKKTDTFNNDSGQDYIYMAFAEAPLVGSNNIPCTAR